MPKKGPVITIDGASGTGKGTVGQLLAKRLGWKFLDSGVLYRVLAYAALKHQVSFDDEKGLKTILTDCFNVEFITKEASDLPQIFLENEEVTEKIRTEQMGNGASKVGAIPSVREALLARQRDFQTPVGLVADGRDMGTVVFPHADLKIFLLASAEERAQRRYKQLKDRGINVTLHQLIDELKERDRRDTERAVAPLKAADDAICIETDHLTIEEVVEKIVSEIERKKAFPAISYPQRESEWVGMGLAE